MNQSLLKVAAVAVLLPSAAVADSKLSPQYSACTAQAAGVTSDLVDCNNLELDRQNARLSQAFKAAVQALPPDVGEKLQASQTLWVKFREEDCAIYYSLTGGTMDMLNGSGCDLNITKTRADDIEWMTRTGGE